MEPQVAAVRLAGAIGHRLNSAAAEWVMEWCADREFNLASSKGLAAVQDLEQIIGQWAESNLAPESVIGTSTLEKMLEELDAGTWLCQPLERQEG